MSTLLFFDDNVLAVRENVIRGVGSPELIPESVWRDDERLSTAWGYPGVFFDEDDGLWRMVYQANVAGNAAVRRWGMRVCKLVAESEDGLQWRPRDTTKLVDIPRRRFPHQVADGADEWAGLYLDERADPSERIKRLAVREVWASPDGLRWRHIADWRPDVVDAPMCAFYNEVFGRHFIIARPGKGDRRVALYQTDDWRSFEGPVLLLQTDGQDDPLTDLYGMPVFPYEGWFIGLVWLYHGAAQFQGSSAYKFTGGKVDCQLAYSLNGLGWQRTLRETFIGNGDPGSPTAGCVYPSSLVMRPDTDDIWIYASACTHEHGLTPRGSGSIVAYRMRRDGFVHLQSRSGVGRIVTKPMYWRGGELRLNVQGLGPGARADPSGNFLLTCGARVQIAAGIRGQPIEGYTFDECRAYAGDSLQWRPTWRSGRKLDQLKGQIIQVGIELNNARLYAIRGDFQLLCPREVLDFEETGEPPAPRPGF